MKQIAYKFLNFKSLNKAGDLLDGIAGGIRANSYGGDFWTGKGPGISSTERVAFNGTQQLAAPKFEIKAYSAEIKSFYIGSEFSFDGENLFLIDNYSNGGQSLNDIFTSVSGSTNYSPIPAEYNYSITSINPNYTSDLRYVRDGVGFFADIEPYNLPNGRFGFEIHPVGAIKGNWWINNGTGGCIGIQENAARLIQLRNFIQKYLQRYGHIPLRVYYY